MIYIRNVMQWSTESEYVWYENRWEWEPSGFGATGSNNYSFTTTNDKCVLFNSMDNTYKDKNTIIDCLKYYMAY